MKYLLAALLLLSCPAFAQYYEVQKTPFNKFVESNSVSWAAYANDRVQFQNDSVSDILCRRALAGKIKAAYPVETGSAAENHIQYLTKASLDSAFAPLEILVNVYDSNGEGTANSPVKMYQENNVKEDIRRNKSYVDQILYVKKGRLYSYISRVSPLRNIVTQAGDTLGTAEFLSFSFNKNYDAAGRKKDKLVYLGQTKNIYYTDSFPARDQLKMLFGQTLPGALWPSVIDEKNKKFFTETCKPAATKEILEGKWTGESASFPMYDSLGNIVESKIVYPEISARIFKKIEITQEWFYNETRDIFFNKIPDFTLYANIADSSGAAELKPAIKIVF